MKRKCKEPGFLYKQNLKIHQNLWKPYAIALAISVIVIGIKGLS